MLELPSVRLDITLAELYAAAGPSYSQKRIGQVLCGANSGLDLSHNVTRNSKFIYQDSPFNTVSHENLNEDNKTLQRSLATKYLSLVPQREAFIVGNVPFFAFEIEPNSVDHDRNEVKTTLAVLDSDQRPDVIFCAGPECINLGEHGVDLLACKVVLDQLEQYPMVIDLEKHWWLNAKEALAKSGLPTPRCKIIELDGYASESDKCCSVCRESDITLISPKCSGERGVWFQRSQQAIIAAIQSQPLPFVAKNQQTFGGAGTWIVNDESDRQQLLDQLSQGLLRRLFSCINQDNYHLKPGTFLLSERVADPIGNYGVTFFVREDGSATILGISEQMVDSKSAWVGSIICYSKQQTLKEKFAALVDQISVWLISHNYVGPVGADVLVTGTNVDESSSLPSTFHIVDLNVRTSGSMCLPLMKGHFSSRGYDFASSFSITINSKRQEFIDKWDSDFDKGQTCIVSWYEDREEYISIADIVVGGQDQQSLNRAMSAIQETTNEVTF